MINLKNQYILKIILIFSFIALISAFFIEYGLGHQPCNLCLIERIPYGLSIIFIFIIFFFKKNEKFFILLLILTFVFSFLISIYHFGIEQGFFQETALCSVKNFTESITKQDLLEQLSQRIISCKDVTFKIFGYSLTSINIVLSLFFIITFVNIYMNYEKNK